MTKTWRLFDFADLTFYDLETGEEVASMKDVSVGGYTLTEQAFDEAADIIMNDGYWIPPRPLGRLYDFRKDCSDEYIVAQVNLGKFRKINTI